MMRFREVKSALISILGAAANDRFQVVGYQRETKAAEPYTGDDRLVEVFYQQSSFPKSSGSPRGPVQHDVTYAVELTVAAASSVDLSQLDTAETDADRLAVMQGFTEAAKLADDAFDEFAEVIFQILMDARNYDLDQPRGTVADRWVSDVRKDETLPQGQLVILTGRITLTVRMAEDVVGEEGVEGELIETTIEHGETDPTDDAGVSVEYPIS